MVDFLKLAILLALAWPSFAVVSTKCDSGFGETVVRLLNSRPDHQSLAVSLVYFQPDKCILNNFDIIVNTVDRKKEYTFFLLDDVKLAEASKPKSHITVIFAKDIVSI
jgi:hypothetical protein